MERLNADCIDLINVHDIEFADLEQVCMRHYRHWLNCATRIVKHIGITNLNLRHFKYVIDHVPQGTVESVLSFVIIH